MTQNILANIFQGGLTVDPSAGAGVAAPIGALLIRSGTGELYQKTGAGDTAWTLVGTGGGGGGGNIVVWADGETWTTVYAEIQALTGPVIVLVEPVAFGSPNHIITPAAAYNINEVQFVSIWPMPSGSIGPEIVVIEIDDGVTFAAAGGVLDKVTISSVNIRWQPECTTTPLVTGKSVRLKLVGEGAGFAFGFHRLAAGGLVFSAVPDIEISLNGCSIVDSGGAPGMISATGAKNVSMVNTSQLSSGAFDDGTLVDVTHDATSLVDSTAFLANPTAATINLFDAAARVSYDDDLLTGVVGSLQSTDVQDAVDALKFMTGAQLRRGFWSAGPQTAATANLTTSVADPSITGTLAGGITLSGATVSGMTFRRSLTSVASANSAAELFTVPLFPRSQFTGYGGFKITLRWMPAVTIPANMRGFFGVSDAAGTLGGANNPLTMVNCLGFSWLTGETNLRFQHNDAAGNATRIDLGADFPTNDATVVMTMQIWCLPAVDQVHWWIKNENLQEVAQGIVTADLPAQSTLLGIKLHANNGGTASACRWDIAHCDFFIP